MPAGLNADLNKRTIDQTCGTAAQALNVAFRNVESAKQFLDTAQDTDLLAFGYEQDDVDTLRSAMGDLDELRQVYEGLIDAPLKDYRAFARRIFGTGFTGQ